MKQIGMAWNQSKPSEMTRNHMKSSKAKRNQLISSCPTLVGLFGADIQTCITNEKYTNTKKLMNNENTIHNQKRKPTKHNHLIQQLKTHTKNNQQHSQI